MKKITLLDGASGTMLWNMAAAEGTEKMPVWKYNVTAPRLVEAGADMLVAGSALYGAEDAQAFIEALKGAEEQF